MFVKRINSSTLIEVIIAMLISSLVFAAGISVVLNSLNGSILRKEYYYYLMAKSVLVKKRSEQDMQSRIISYDMYVVKEEVVDCSLKEGLKLLTVEIIGLDGEVIAISRCIMRSPNE